MRWCSLALFFYSSTFLLLNFPKLSNLWSTICPLRWTCLVICSMISCFSCSSSRFFLSRSYVSCNSYFWFWKCELLMEDFLKIFASLFSFYTSLKLTSLLSIKGDSSSSSSHLSGTLLSIICCTYELNPYSLELLLRLNIARLISGGTCGGLLSIWNSSCCSSLASPLSTLLSSSFLL